MIISDITISNLFSYQESNISFGRYNVITGINGAGKSNLIRILKRIIASPSYGFSTSYLENHQKFDQNKGSSIRIGIKFSQTESCLISRLVFRNTEGKFQNGEFILSWDGPRWNQIIKCALILQNKLIIWHDGKSSKFGIIPNGQNRDKLFEYLNDIRTMTNAEIEKRKEEKNMTI